MRSKEYGSRRGRERAARFYPDTIRGMRVYEQLFDIGVRDLGTTLNATRGVVEPGVRVEVRSAFAEYVASELARSVPVPDVQGSSDDPQVVWTRLMYQEVERRGLGNIQPTQTPLRPRIFRVPWRQH